MTSKLPDDAVELQPTGNRMVALQERTTESGLLVPLERTPAQRLTVGSVGEGVSGRISTGDEVIVKPGAATEVTLGDRSYLIFSEPDVLAVVRGRPGA